ncbi:hypothetical protein RIF29_29685 [Crotalaria pallida]|uniref:Uncharacterized protein n=1 Tax=Crotalaria pallida TaxID=3830 RepID=A0AAN9EHC4_CROPI
MTSIQTSPLFSSSLSSKRINSLFNVPMLPRANFSLPRLPTNEEVHELKLTGSAPFMNANNSTTHVHNEIYNNSTNSNSPDITQLYAILEVVGDRFEMHRNVGEQRDNWNNLLLNNINMITLTAATLTGVASSFSGDEGTPLLALKISSSLLFSPATGLLLININEKQIKVIYHQPQ